MKNPASETMRWAGIGEACEGQGIWDKKRKPKKVLWSESTFKLVEWTVIWFVFVALVVALVAPLLVVGGECNFGENDKSQGDLGFFLSCTFIIIIIIFFFFIIIIISFFPWLSEKEEIFVFFLGSLWETRGGWSLWDLCGVGGREGGREDLWSFSFSSKGCILLCFSFFFLAFWGGFAVVWGAGLVGKVPMFLQFWAPTAVVLLVLAAVGATGKDFLNILEVCWANKLLSKLLSFFLHQFCCWP